MAIASARTLRMPPRKARLVADLIRGKSVVDARNILAVNEKGSAPLIKKVLESAVANAENEAAQERRRIDTDDWKVQYIVVNEGITIKRFTNAARGRAVRIRKRTCHVELKIADAETVKAARK
ncbi:MAG: 50S ribosomal protein L22 [Candidatus Hydrogenedentales bacterium]